MLIQNYSNLTLDNMTLTLDNPNYSGAYTLSNNNGNVTIKDTTINANPAGAFAFDVCRYASYPSVNVTVTGDSVINGDVEVSASGSDPKEGFSLDLESGTLTGDVVLDQSAKTAMANNPEKAVVEKKDTFASAAPEGYEWVSDGNGGSTLVEEGTVDVVAQIGDTKFESLADAIANVGDGEVIEMVADVNDAVGISVPSGKNFTVDFKDHTYTVNKPGAGSSGTETQAFQLLKDSTITFKNGTINISEENLTPAVAPAKNILRVIQNYANLTLENMTIDAQNQYGYYQGGKYGLSFNNGESVIKDTTIITNGDDVVAFDVYLNEYYTATSVDVQGTSDITGSIEVCAKNATQGEKLNLTLSGGTLSGDIIMDSYADEATITKGDGFNQAAPEGYQWNDNGDGTSTLGPKPPVAKIGDNEYMTLEEAFAAAQDGDTITVLADCSGNGIKAPQGKFQPNGLTVDFDGHTYTMDGNMVGSTGTETQAFQLLKDNNITFKNGNLTSEKAKMLIQNYSNLTLDNMTLTLDNPNYSGAYTLSNNNGNVTIKDTTINANPAGAFAFDVCRYASYPSVNVTVTGNSVINGDVEVSASGSDPKEGFSLDLESGKLNGDIVLDDTAKTAMDEAPEKAVVMKKDTFNQVPPEGYIWESNGDGTSSLVPGALEGVEGFVYRLYNVCLDREPDADGLSHWVDELTSGRQTGTQVAYNFVFSNEFKKKNLCNEHYIKQLYVAIMGRDFDEDGFNHWMGQMKNGMTREAVFNNFTTSREFNNICTSYGINAGSPIALPQYGTVPTGPCSICGEKDNVTQFVERMYTEVLGRNPDATGLNDWTSRLWNHSATGRSVANSFIFSNEYIRKNTSNEAYVNMLYKTMMNREADAGGLNDWLTRLNSGWSRQDVFNSFVSSNEFNKICNNYGITRG